MNRKRAIKRMLLTLMWLCVAAGMGVIITAAMRVQETGVCAGYKIKIVGFNPEELFTSEEHIAELLKAATKGQVKGQPKTDFDLPVIEDLLEQSAWVYNADLYFDNTNVLHAVVTERKPLARVFARNGNSFYIDEAGKQIPLSEKVSLDLPVFTGYPDKKVLTPSDSALIQNVIATASYIKSDPFWNLQVAQIDITNCGADCWNMEMIPVVGNHKVELGDGSDIASKFHRLLLFYDQVLTRTGFDKYQKIDVQYDGQIVGVKGNYTKIDSIQLRKNIEDLLSASRASNEILQLAPATIPDNIDSIIEPKLTATDSEVQSDSSASVVDVDKNIKSDNVMIDDSKLMATALSASTIKSVTKKPVIEKNNVHHNTEKTLVKPEHSRTTVTKKSTSPVRKVVNEKTETKSENKSSSVKKMMNKTVSHSNTEKKSTSKEVVKKASTKTVAHASVKKAVKEKKATAMVPGKKSPVDKKLATKPSVKKEILVKKTDTKPEVKKANEKNPTKTTTSNKEKSKPVVKKVESKKKN